MNKLLTKHIEEQKKKIIMVQDQMQVYFDYPNQYILAFSQYFYCLIPFQTEYIQIVYQISTITKCVLHFFRFVFSFRLTEQIYKYIIIYKPIATMSYEQFNMQGQNLIPFYFIEDRLKSNFSKINQFIAFSLRKNQSIDYEIRTSKQNQIKFQGTMQELLKQMERKIIQSLSSELQGKIAVTLSQRMAGLIDAAQKRQEAMDSFQANIDKKLEELKKSLKYDISQENQKYFMKEIKKVNENIRSQKTMVSKKRQLSVSRNSARKKSMSNVNNQGVSNKQVQQEKSQARQQDGVEGAGGDWQEGLRQFRQVDDRIKKIEQFIVGFEKRFQNNMISLKDTWKQLGTQLLDNKKLLNRKMQETKIELVKLKNMKDFQVLPQKAQEHFKAKLTQKFTEFYKMLADSVNKTEFQTNMQQMKKTVGRHNDQLFDIREELNKNNQYFTFYMNNSDNDNLHKQINDLSEQIQDQKSKMSKKISAIEQQNIKLTEKFDQLSTSLLESKQTQLTIDKMISKQNQVIDEAKGRIQALQDYNKFGPDKMSKIHNFLDVNLSLPEQQLIQKKPRQQNNPNQALARQLRSQISKLKDQIFVINTLAKQKDSQLAIYKKMIAGMENRIQKIKIQAEEAVVSRKPWVCLSCDKQQQKEPKSNTKPKKTEPFKGAGGFIQNKLSEKNIKMAPATFEQRFQVYQKMKDKYLSDTVKLPEIYREKFGDAAKIVEKDNSVIQ